MKFCLSATITLVWSALVLTAGASWTAAAHTGGEMPAEPSAGAGDVLESGSEASRRQRETVGPWAFKRIQRAQDALAAEQYEEALAALDEMKPNPKLNSHERAIMWQTYGFVYSARDRYAEAADAFAQSLACGGLADQAQLQTRYSLAQLYLLLERSQDAIRELSEWFAHAHNPSPAAYYLFAMAFVQKGDPVQALRYAERAVERSGGSPSEPWLQLVSALRLQLKQLREAIPVIEQLIVRYPRKQYWLQLSAVYSGLDEPARALAVLELAHRQGLLTEGGELMGLAQLYLYNQIPYRAADVLAEGMRRGAIAADARAYRLLADSLLHARERRQALEPLRRAAELSADGNAYVRLAQVHLEREEWAPAREALAAAIEKGKLTSAGHAYLLLGIASANEQRWAEAEKAFASAQDFEPTETMAAQWLRHLASQRGSDNENAEQVARGIAPPAADAGAQPRT
jgi:tetratricopeptide (TPR) repeat protein